MTAGTSDSPRRPASKMALRVAAVYFAFGFLWILLSDQLLAMLATDRELELRLQTAKGWIYVFLTAALVYFLVRRDFQRLQESERLRLRNEQHYLKIVETALEGMCTTDPSGRITWASRRFNSLLGLGTASPVGQPLLTWVDPEFRQSLPGQMMEAKGEAGPTRDLKLRRPDGSEVWVLASLSPLFDEHGQPAGWLWTLTDITERKALEGRLAQAQKMEALGRLAGGIAHDFNNILTVILGHTSMLRNRLTSDGPAAGITQDLDLIERAGRRAVDLTRQLLTFSRRRLPHIEVLDLWKIIREMERVLARVIREDIALELNCDPDTRPVRGDAGQFEQILLNLVLNARDAMPGGGRIAIETGNLTVGPEGLADAPEVPPGAYVYLSVSDTGAGIDPAHLGRIFEPFFTTKPEGEGTGLGLATVYGIVQQMGGHISVRSQVGQGSTFHILLPAAPREQQPDADRTASDQPLGGHETILLCEDNEGVRLLTSRILTSRGYRVLEAADPRTALSLAAARRETIDLLIADVILPGMNGPQLADQLRSIHPGLKVMYISGYTAEMIAAHGVLETGIEFLEKPFTAADLLARVRRTLDANRSVVSGTPATPG